MKVIFSILATLLPMLAWADNEEQVFYPRRVVMEEATGTWCGWCVRGIETIERMKQEYPDNFIAIAIHDGDEMDNVENYKFLMDIVPGYPSCFINRSANSVSYDIAKNAVSLNKENGIARIESKAAFTDGSRTSVSVSTETVFGFSPNSSSYKISYVVVEDSVGPYTQENYYSGNFDFSDPNNYMYGWYLKPARVAVVFNDVARGIYEDTNSENFPDQIQKGTPYQNSFTFQLPFNIGDKDHIRIVVLLIDEQTGEIVNASQSSVTGDKDREQPLHDGDTFVAKSIEGINITFTVISEAEKTCRVGANESWAIDKKQAGVLTIPGSANGYTVVAIGVDAFYSCQKIEEFHLPNTIKTIEPGAFSNTRIMSIDIPESVEEIGNGAFEINVRLKHVSFHEGLKTIGASAFIMCALTSIDLPKSIEFIGRWAFCEIPKLATITVRSSASISHDDRFRIFDDIIYKRATLYVPQGTTDIFKGDDQWGRFRIIKEGAPLPECPEDIAYPKDFGMQRIVFGNPVTINIDFENQRTTPVSTISYVPTVDGIEGEEQTCEFPEPIAADDKPFTLPVTLPDFDEPQEKEVFVDITKINGVTVEYGPDIRSNAYGSAAVIIPAPNHRVLIKDYVSNTKPYSIRSNIGYEKLREKYGDKVIRASFYVGGPMWCSPSGYDPPLSSRVDGSGSLDPYYGEGTSPLGIIEYVDKIMAQPPLGNLKILSAQWADEDQTEINVVIEVTMGMSNNEALYHDAPYRCEYLLVEDGLTGDGSEWDQINGYSGQTIDDPYLQPLTELPYTITNMVYDNVVVADGSTDYYGNWEGLLFQPFTYGEPQQQTITLELSRVPRGIIQDKSKLSVVAYLRTGGNNLLIIDSDKYSLSGNSSDVKGIRQNASTHDVYDLSGRKVKAAATTLDDLPKGVYIYNGKKVVIGR